MRQLRIWQSNLEDLQFRGSFRAAYHLIERTTLLYVRLLVLPPRVLLLLHIIVVKEKAVDKRCLELVLPNRGIEDTNSSQGFGLDQLI
jgi:hypothetical protein